MNIDFSLPCGCKGRYVDGLSTITVPKRTCKHRRRDIIDTPASVRQAIIREETRMRVQINLEWQEGKELRLLTIPGAPDSVPQKGEHITHYGQDGEPTELTVVGRHFIYQPFEDPNGLLHVTLECDLGHVTVDPAVAPELAAVGGSGEKKTDLS